MTYKWFLYHLLITEGRNDNDSVYRSICCTLWKAIKPEYIWVTYKGYTLVLHDYTGRKNTLRMAGIEILQNLAWVSAGYRLTSLHLYISIAG